MFSCSLWAYFFQCWQFSSKGVKMAIPHDLSPEDPTLIGLTHNNIYFSGSMSLTTIFFGNVTSSCKYTLTLFTIGGRWNQQPLANFSVCSKNTKLLGHESPLYMVYLCWSTSCNVRFHRWITACISKACTSTLFHFMSNVWFLLKALL